MAQVTRRGLLVGAGSISLAASAVPQAEGGGPAPQFRSASAMVKERFSISGPPTGVQVIGRDLSALTTIRLATLI